MNIGCCLITTGEAPMEPGLADMARRAERVGAASLWVNDHLVLVDDPQSYYPYSEDGRPTWTPDLAHYESLTALAFAGAVTSRIRLGTAALILPQRNVIELAKVTASLDRLTRGRLILGVGIGWQKEEMEALGYDFATRVTRTEEMVGALRQLWRGRPEPLSGSAVTVAEGLVSEPRPWRATGVPVLFGGMVAKARSRAARLGDGWVAVAGVDQIDIPGYRDHILEMRSHRAESGEDPKAFETVLRLYAPQRSASELLPILGELEDAGFDEVGVEMDWTDPDAAEVELSKMVRAFAPAA